MSAKGIGELLVLESLINIHQLEDAKKMQKKDGGRLGSALVKLGYIDEKKLSEFMSQQYGVPSIDLSSFQIDPKAIKLIPKDMCEKHNIIPVSYSGNVLVVAMVDPSNIFIRDDLAFLTKSKIQAVVAPESQIIQAIKRNYESKVSYENIMSEIERETVITTNEQMAAAPEEPVSSDNPEAPVIQFVNMMLQEAMALKASDIHIEPYEKKFRIRFRIDGDLYEKVQPPTGIANAIASRLKIMSKLDIAERRRPQDGRLKLKTRDNREMDFRVSVLPNLFGEKIVMRLLDKSNLQLDMTKLGFEQHQLDLFTKSIKKPYGIVLICGPTGSGKTTTIYSALAELNTPDINISTAEDPVEFNLEGINQFQMNKDVGLDFAAALRSFLRQDPDVIMVGEIRDLETAEIAFKAALTGHLVVSTLHTNDAPQTINRLINMGIEPFLVTSAVNAVIAQRLVRKICESCKVPVNLDARVYKDLGIPENEIGKFETFKGEGCTICNNTGYKGRLAIYEVLDMTDEMKILVFKNLSPIEFKRKAVEYGLQSLRMSALNKFRQGLTTAEEVLSTTIEEEEAK